MNGWKWGRILRVELGLRIGELGIQTGGQTTKREEKGEGEAEPLECFIKRMYPIS